MAQQGKRSTQGRLQARHDDFAPRDRQPTGDRTARVHCREPRGASQTSDAGELVSPLTGHPSGRVRQFRVDRRVELVRMECQEARPPPPSHPDRPGSGRNPLGLAALNGVSAPPPGPRKRRPVARRVKGRFAVPSGRPLTRRTPGRVRTCPREGGLVKERCVIAQSSGIPRRGGTCQGAPPRRASRKCSAYYSTASTLTEPATAQSRASTR